jgi:hypothetical protein
MSPIALVTPLSEDFAAYRSSLSSMEHSKYNYDDIEMRCEFPFTSLIANAPRLPNLDVGGSSCINEEYMRSKYILPQRRHGDETCQFGSLIQDKCERRPGGSSRFDGFADRIDGKRDSKLLVGIPYFPSDIEMDDTKSSTPRTFLKPRNQSKRCYNLSF